MLERLAGIEERYEELGNLIGDPEIIADLDRWQQYVKAHADLADVVAIYRDFKKVNKELQEAKTLLVEEPDIELREMVQTEMDDLAEKKSSLEQRLK